MREGGREGGKEDVSLTRQPGPRDRQHLRPGHLGSYGPRQDTPGVRAQPPCPAVAGRGCVDCEEQYGVPGDDELLETDSAAYEVRHPGVETEGEKMGRGAKMWEV